MSHVNFKEMAILNLVVKSPTHFHNEIFEDINLLSPSEIKQEVCE